MVDEGIRQAHLRIARPTDNLEQITKFYKEGLGFEVLASFENHQGFDGVMLGHPNLPYHLEFTHQRGHSVGKAPSQEHLLVLYIPDQQLWKQSVERFEKQGFRPVVSPNPYWGKQGKTFEDPDGYRIVLQNASWS
jgi:catechol 2,3-dioxygenase-like lactoylglutathione lyase family enzyme